MQNDLRNRMAPIPHTRAPDDADDEHPPGDATPTAGTTPLADATTRKQGRPKGAKSGKAKAQKQPATTTLPPDSRVPSLACPACGLAIWPRTLRGANKDGEIPCECPCCAHRFGYTPPQVRSL